MIAQLKGRIVDIEGPLLTLDVAGVGYELQCSGNTLDQLCLEDSIRIYVSTQVREDAIQLYGFSLPVEKKIFLSLIKVNGVGAKMAIGILSGASVERIRNWIEAGDVKGLTSLPKVGKKTAEQIVLALKGKLVFADDALPSLKPKGTAAEVGSALVNLGFRPLDVGKVVDGLPQDISLEDGVRQGLASLSNL